MTRLIRTSTTLTTIRYRSLSLMGAAVSFHRSWIIRIPLSKTRPESCILYTKEDVSTKTSKNYGFVLTRPMKFGAALSMKSIRQVIHLYSNVGNGSFVKYNLYGSNDNVNYYRVSSRFGKPYKYYRVAIYTYLLPKESLSGSALTIERRDHKLRR